MDFDNQELDIIGFDPGLISEFIAVKYGLKDIIRRCIMSQTKYKMIKAHFYAPRKQVFGNYFSTYAVNVAVIWFMTLIFYLILYYRLLKKFLDFFEQLSQRFKREV